ncbi:MAG: DUF2029 domain-containing protein, partial [Staphylococcus hominis]
MRKLILSVPMMAVALILCLASLLVGWYQHSYVPFYTTDRRDVEDFLVYYRGAKAFWDSPNVYESLINTGAAGELPYSYPPSSLLFFSPLTLFGETVGLVLFSLVSLAALWWVITLTLRRCRIDDAGKWALVALPLAFWIDPIHNTFHHGQVNIVLMALVLTDLWWDSPKRKYLPTGVLTGVAAAVKMTPALFGLYFIFTRNWKALAAAFLTGVMSLGVAGAVKPAALGYYFTTQIGQMSGVLGLNRAHNQSARGLVARFVPADAQTYFTAIMFAGILALALLALRSLLAARANEAAVLCVALLSLLVAPITWQHHYVWVVPLCIVMAVGGIRNANPWPPFLVAVYLTISTIFIPHKQILNPMATTPDSYTVRDLAQSSLVVWAILVVFVMWVQARGFVLVDRQKPLRFTQFVAFPPLVAYAVLSTFATAWWRKMESPMLSAYEGVFHPLEHLQMLRGAGDGFFAEPDIYSVAFSYPDGRQDYFLHPPVTMLFGKLLGAGEMGTWEALHTIAGTLAVWWIIYLLFKRFRWPSPVACATVLLPAVLWLDPVRFNFYYGELTIFAVAFVATDLWWTRPGQWQRWVPEGLLTGIAAAFTLRPAVFALYFLFRNVLHIGERYDLSQAQNLTLFGAAQRFTGADGASALWVLAVLAAGGALIYAARVFIQRGEAPMAALSLALVALTASSWAPPYAWAWMLPGVFIIGEFAWRRRDIPALLTTLVYLGLSTVFVPHSQFKNMDTIDGRDRVIGDWVMSSVVWWTLLAAAVFA